MSKLILKDGTRIYLENGKLHRYNGPAVIYKDGQLEYWIHGRRSKYSGFAIVSEKFKIKIRNSKVVRKSTDNISKQSIDEYISLIKRTYNTMSNASLEELGIGEREWEETEKEITRYYKNGIQHKDDGPAETMKNGTMIYMKYGLKHNEEGPCLIDKRYRSSTWYYYGLIHRENGPAIISYKNRNKNIRNETWVNYSYVHRVGGPAMIDIDEQNDRTVYEAWYINGKHNREDGPCKTMLVYDIFMERATGEIVKIWITDGEFHRLGGPAVESGVYNDWYIHGHKYTEEEYKKTMNMVSKALYKFKKPLRQRLKNAIYNCNIYGINKDISQLISEYAY